MAKKPRNERFVSPKGRFVYPWLSTPDTKFDAEGVYRVRLALPAAEAGDFIEMLQEKADNHLANNEAKVRRMGSLPWSLDEETNEYLVNFKMKAVVKPQNGEPFTQRPVVFDASGQTCNGLRIGGGTVGRISYEIIPFANKMIGAGISLRLKAVQVIDLVEYGQQNAESYGFDETEGYTKETNEFEAEEAAGAEENYDF